MGKKRPEQMPRRAYSYLRVSCGAQVNREGKNPETAATGLARQQGYAARRAEREGWFLDNTLTFSDPGRSAFHMDNLKPNADLARFLKLIEEGTVLPGEVLIIENIDRLTRADVRTAFKLWCSILDAGVWIATEIPEKLYTPEQSGLSEILDPIIQMVGNHSFSAKLSERITNNWSLVREAARTGRPHGRNTPAWIIETPAGYALDPVRSAVVRRLIELSLSGMGSVRLARHANANLLEFPPPERTGHWTHGNIQYILSHEALKGVYQPMGGRPKKPIGPPIPDYYPAILTPDEWDALQAAVSHRKKHFGRVHPQIRNLFTGIAFFGRWPAQIAGSFTKDRKHDYYLRGMLDGGNTVHLAYTPTERAILYCLAQLKPADVLPRNGKPSEMDSQIDALERRLLAIDHRIEENQRLLSDPECGMSSAEIAAANAALREQRAATQQELSPLRWERQNPALEHLAGIQALIDLLQKMEEEGKDLKDIRSRLRGKIPSLVTRINLVGEPLSKRRIYGHAMIFFRDGEPRYIGIEPRRGVPRGDTFADLSDPTHPAWAVGHYARDTASA